jgi:hypothetical protein
VVEIDGRRIAIDVDVELDIAIYIYIAILYSLFFIIGPCYLNVLQVIITHIFYEHITHATVNISVETSDPS